MPHVLPSSRHGIARSCFLLLMLLSMIEAGCGGSPGSSRYTSLPATSSTNSPGAVKRGAASRTPVPTATPPASMARLPQLREIMRRTALDLAARAVPPTASPKPNGRRPRIHVLAFDEGSDESQDACPSDCVISGQELEVQLGPSGDAGPGTLTLIVNQNGNSWITASSSSYPCPPCVMDLVFQPTSSPLIATGRYHYSYQYSYAPDFGPGGYTTGVAPEQIDVACSIALHTCPEVEIYDNILNQQVGASPSPAATSTTIVGLSQSVSAKWISGTGKTGVSYTFSSDNNPNWEVDGYPYLASPAPSAYPLQSMVETGTPPISATGFTGNSPTPYFWGTLSGIAGPYTNNVIVYDVSPKRRCRTR